MKLIVEDFDDISSRVDEQLNEKTGKKDVFIEGVFAQTIKNRNGRIYPKKILEKQIDNYKTEYVDKRRALGELNHPTTLAIDPDRVCHKVVDVKWLTEEDVWGKAKLTNTPKGNLVRNLVIDDDVELGVSTRGVGSVKSMNEGDVVQNDYFLKCWDVVTDPSAPAAFVNGLMENKEWIFVDGILVEREIEDLKTEVDKLVRVNRFNDDTLDEIFSRIIHKL